MDKTNIEYLEYEFNWDSLFPGLSDYEGINQEASKQEYADMLKEALQGDFPNATIHITNSLKENLNIEPHDDHTLREKVWTHIQELRSSIFEDGVAWIVMEGE